MMLRTFIAIATFLAATAYAEENVTAAADSPEVSVTETPVWPMEVREGVFNYIEGAADSEMPASAPSDRRLRATADVGERRSLRTNQNDVRAGVEARCDVVLWGEHIGHDDYATLFTSAVLDSFGGGGNFMFQWIMDQLGDQALAFGLDTVRHLMNGGSVDVSRGKVTGGVASFKHWTDECRCCASWTFTGCSCSKCGTWKKTEPNTHQPFICINYKPGTASAAKEIRIAATHDQHLCMDIHGTNQNVYMYSCHGGSNQKWYLASDDTFKSPWNGGLCLDWDTVHNVYMHPCHGGNNQKWTFSHGRIRNMHDTSLCLDMDPSGKNLYMGPCHLGWNQFFRWA